MNTHEQHVSKKIKISPLGSFLYVNSEGFLERPQELGNFQQEWKPVVDAFVTGFADTYGDDLHSIYIRGSVAKGKAIPGVSDLDAYIITHERLPDERLEWVHDFCKGLKQKYPFVQGFETPHYSLKELEDSPRDQMILGFSAVCVHGDDLLPTYLRKYRPGPETVLHAFSITRPGWFDDNTRKFTDPEASTKQRVQKCTWLAKSYLRAGHELVAERSGRYTRDLYKCWEGFSEYYPEHSENMYAILELALNPTDDLGQITKVIGDMRTWMPAEINNIFGTAKN